MVGVTTRRIAWGGGTAEICSTAGMLTDAEFHLGDRRVRPLARAPWHAADPVVAGEPGHVRVLGGEFVCLPFGSAPVPVDAAAGWRIAAAPNEPPHGPPADLEWTFPDPPGDDSARLVLDLHSDADVRRLERTVRGIPGDTGLEFELTVHARRAHRSPVGLHPILRLPAAGEHLRISARFGEGLTYPGTLDGGSGLLHPAASFSDLRAVPARKGFVDLAVLSSSDPPREEVVQLLDARSPIVVHSSGGYRVEVHWDDALLPSVLLWVSDRHLSGMPWGGSYRGLGVEPIASAFDLPAGVSLGSNPIAARGVATSLAFDPREATVVRSAVLVKDTT